VGLSQQIRLDLLEGSGRSVLDDETGDWSGGFHQRGAEANVDGISEEVCHTCTEDDDV
jgi:hypothetical protein